MEKIIYERDNMILTKIEQVERCLLKTEHFSNLNTKTRAYLSEAITANDNLKKLFFSKPRNSMRQIADVMNFYLTRENLDGMTLHLHKGIDARKERFVQYNHYLSYENIK